MKTTISLTLCCLLSGCAYRYGTGYFMNDLPPTSAPTAYASAPATPPPVETATPKEPCVEEGVKTTTLEVTNQLDSKNQTIKTTAVTETHTTPPVPCP